VGPVGRIRPRGGAWLLPNPLGLGEVGGGSGAKKKKQKKNTKNKKKNTAVRALGGAYPSGGQLTAYAMQVVQQKEGRLGEEKPQ